MSSDNPNDDEARQRLEALRAKVESRLRGKGELSLEVVQEMAPQEVQLLFHELQVHRIELEMQNQELRDATEALDATRARFVDLYDLAPMGYCTVNAAGVITQANLTLATLLGVARSVLQGQALSRFIQPQDQDAYYLLQRDWQATDGARCCELRIKSSDGQHLWMRLDVAPATVGNTERRITVTDIQAQRQAQDTLQINDAAFKAITQGIIMATPDHVIVSANAAFLAITGYTEVEVIGRNCRFLQGPDSDANTIAAIGSALRRHTGFDGEILNYRKDGTPFWNALTISPVVDAQGALTHYVGVTRDITERKAAEAAVIESQTLVQTIVDTVPGMLAYWGTDLTCRFANSAYQEWFGRSAEAMQGISMPELLGDALFQKNELFVRAALAGQSQQFERTLAKADGSTGYTLAQYVVHRAHGKVDGFLALVTDVTDIKQIQLALAQSVADKEALLKEVHHRVKNNLQVIISLLRMEAYRSTAPEAVHVLKAMQGRIFSMSLLHESLYRSGTFASVDLGDYLGKIATQAHRMQMVQEQSVQLQLNLASVPVGMDQAISCGLLVNELVSNCLKHGFADGRAGEVRVGLEPANPDTVQQDALWRLQVSDTGVGLPPDFEDKRKTSLGLQLVGDLSRQVGGQLQIESQPGAGTIFTVVLKVLTPQALVIPA